MKKMFYGWWVVAAAFCTFGLSVGLPYYTISFFYDYFGKTYGWRDVDITRGFLYAALLTLWVGPVLVPRFSPRKLILVGTALTCIALFCFGIMGPNIWVYWGIWVIYAMGYFLSGPIPHQIIISNWFRKNRGKAMGVLYVGVGIDRFPRGENRKAAHGGPGFPQGADDHGRNGPAGLAAGDLRAARQARRKGPLPGWRGRAAGRDQGQTPQLPIPHAPLLLLAAGVRQHVLHRLHRRGQFPDETGVQGEHGRGHHRPAAGPGSAELHLAGRPDGDPALQHRRTARDRRASRTSSPRSG